MVHWSEERVPVVPNISDASLQPSRFIPLDVKKQLEALDTTKAIGPDNIPDLCSRTCRFHSQALPVQLQHWHRPDNVENCPEHKKQDKSNPAKYHPISLLLIISKVMEGVINRAIKQHLLSNNLLNDAQFGFRQDHLAPDLTTALVQTWTKELNSRGEVRVTALDIKAAVDQGWHPVALAELGSTDIRGQTLH